MFKKKKLSIQNNSKTCQSMKEWEWEEEKGRYYTYSEFNLHVNSFHCYLTFLLCIFSSHDFSQSMFSCLILYVSDCDENYQRWFRIQNFHFYILGIQILLNICCITANIFWRFMDCTNLLSTDSIFDDV